MVPNGPKRETGLQIVFDFLEIVTVIIAIIYNFDSFIKYTVILIHNIYLLILRKWNNELCVHSGQESESNKATKR